MKSIYTFIYLSLSFVYLEFVFKLLNSLTIFSLTSIQIVMYAIILSALLSYFIDRFTSKTRKILISILLLILGILFSAQLCVYSMYGFFLQISSFVLANQVASFIKDAIKVVLNNLLGISLLLIPCIINLFIHPKNSEVDNWLNSLLKAVFVMFGALFIYISILYSGSVLEQTYKSSNFIQTIDKSGVLNSILIDTINNFKNEETVIVVEEEEVKEEEPEVIVYGYNNLDIDFNKLADSENSSYVDLSNYFASKTGSLQNEYTGYFEGKNLILFMAESFNSIAVSKELTPTLYKLVHSGFDFTNFYTPTILSTIGGEYCELTGLFPELGSLPNSLSIFRNGTNDYPMGIGNVFKEKGYTTRAYHNSDYDFQDRNVYLEKLGFDSFKACGLGLDVDCTIWPKSDIEMIEKTFDDYINDDNFLVFYASVSGHGPYVFDTSDNDIAVKYEDILREYYGDKLGSGSAADTLMAYVAGQMELDRALELLISKLKAAGKLEDTVIALVGDHHPYYITDSLSMEQYNKLSTYERDSTIELYRSNFILYCGGMEPVVVDKVGSQLDVLPTIYNIFGIDYDSRLLMGNDILSTSPGLAIMGDSSWVSDYGKYYASSGNFVINQGMSVSDTYVENQNKKVANIEKISRLMMRSNYYKYVFDNMD